MAAILIMGESGSGKTTSMRNLDPKTTMYIDCDKKGLAWKGWRKQYNTEAKNYFACDDPDIVLTLLKRVNLEDQFRHITVCVIDTLNGMMVADEMRRSKEKGYDKWQDLAFSVYSIVDYALKVREDLTVIFTAHAQTDHDENGYLFIRTKTSGKKLDKIVLESKFPVVLLAKGDNGEYVFETRANHSTAKTPLGAFETNQIPNDITAVLEALKEY
ncbi:MAG: AAA family ATPase [Firmicutes bacterium]|nr:AAA family ATPase [Bacillota bacterium]